MAPLQKIATCCYCSRRTTLTLQGQVQHELACTSCGAPLRRMKMLPMAQLVQPKPAPRPKPKSNPKRRKKPKLKRVLSKLWDELEDIFD